jgi:hypothetical protein
MNFLKISLLVVLAAVVVVVLAPYLTMLIYIHDLAKPLH